MATNPQISAVDIKRLWYADADAVSQDLTGALVHAMVKEGGTATEIENVHQDTWSIEEAEPSQDSYKTSSPAQHTGWEPRLWET